MTYVGRDTRRMSREPDDGHHRHGAGPGSPLGPQPPPTRSRRHRMSAVLSLPDLLLVVTVLVAVALVVLAVIRPEDPAAI